MTKKEVKELLSELHPNTIGYRKNGNILCRWGFFYSHGGSSEKCVEKVKALLDLHNVRYSIADSGEVWKAFRGGASVANQSHWFVEIKIKGE